MLAAPQRKRFLVLPAIFFSVRQGLQVLLYLTCRAVVSRAASMTVVVIPKPADAKDEPALATPLSLTATPEEFDAEFTTVLAGYRTQRLSLAEQVAATNEVLAAAREASVQKGSKAATTATARTSAKHVTATVAAPDDAAAGEELDDDESDAAQAPVTSAGTVTAAGGEPARAGAPDLFG